MSVSHHERQDVESGREQEAAVSVVNADESSAIRNWTGEMATTRLTAWDNVAMECKGLLDWAKSHIYRRRLDSAERK
jgi:hypothetical protein